MGEDHSKKISELISRAWSDEAFKKRLLSDTMTVLKENGIFIPEGVIVKAAENSENMFHLVIPAKPVSDADLDKVAGGAFPTSVFVVLPPKRTIVFATTTLVMV